MCVAVPGKIVELLDGGVALVDFMGVRKRVALDLIEDARLGEHVIVHAGFAIQKLNAEEARETIGYFRELAGSH
ncbi:MAG: HypC/HybG/HupF family hydrogenase formation chaperone [Chlamydiota bacterium]